MSEYVMDYDGYVSVARQAAAEGIVLLKNETQILPLQEGTGVSIFGRIQFDYYKSGTGSGGMVNTRYVVGILDALQEENLLLNEELLHIYKEWIAEHPFAAGDGWATEPWSQEEMPLSEELVKQAASCSDTAIVIIGRTAGEDKDAEAQKGSYYLSDTEEDMLSKVCSHFDRVAVLLNVGSIMDMSWVKKYRPGAVLYVWQGGQEGGHGVADVLMGRVNPCGRLTDTIAEKLSDYPAAANFGSQKKNVYAEDIYVGYRYFETFAKDKVLYPFGYGLSYTEFEVQPYSVGHTAGKTKIVLKVTNTGTRSGKEVVQVYVSAPQGLLGKPARSLVAYQKTRELKPGETETMNFAVSDYTLASYDDGGVTGYRSCYVLEEGKYEFYAGSNVRDAGYIGYRQEKRTRIVEELQEAAAPKEAFQRLKPDAQCAQTEGYTWETVPVRTKSVAQHMEEDLKAESGKALPYTGDQGHRLRDVRDGRVSMEEFLAQLSDYDLCCIVKGEGMCSPKVTPGTAAAFGGLTDALQAFGIPCGCCADGPSGIRMDCGTVAFSLPGGACLACTFDDDLNEKLYAFEGAELRQNRIDTLLGPGINIHRHPLNGRNFEYFSEDPLVTGRLAAAQLHGMARCKVTGTIKHFACNNQESHRTEVEAVVSERALRELYLRGFEIAVREGGAYSVMTSYNPVNGVWTAGNYDLCTRILRKEWHFEGMVMSDWGADISREGSPAAKNLYAAMVKAQNDVYMVISDTTADMGDLETCLQDCTLTREELARSAKNILTVLMKSPVMEDF